MIEISSCMNSQVIWHPPPTPPIPNYTNKTIPNHAKPYQTIPNNTKPYHISSLYLQLSITAILIHNATLLSFHFRKIGTVSHFRLVLHRRFNRRLIIVTIDKVFKFELHTKMNPNHYNINWSWKIVFVTRKVHVQRNCWNEEFHKIRINLLASNGGWQIILDYPRLNHIDPQKWMMNCIIFLFSCLKTQ